MQIHLICVWSCSQVFLMTMHWRKAADRMPSLALAHTTVTSEMWPRTLQRRRRRRRRTEACRIWDLPEVCVPAGFCTCRIKARIRGAEPFHAVLIHKDCQFCIFQGCMSESGIKRYDLSVWWRWHLLDHEIYFSRQLL